MDSHIASANPDVIWVQTPAKLTAAAVDRILGELEGYLKRRKPYVLLFELGHGLPDAAQRKRLTDHMKTNEATIVRLVAGLGVVVSSGLARSVMTAILWFAPPAMPHRLFATREEAEAWAQATIEAKRSRAA